MAERKSTLKDGKGKSTFMWKESKKRLLQKYVKSDFNPEKEWNMDPTFLNKNKQLSTLIEKPARETPIGIMTALKKLSDRKNVHIMISDYLQNTKE